MKTKQIIALTLSAVLALSMIGCTAEENTNNGNDSSSETTTTTAETSAAESEETTEAQNFNELDPQKLMEEIYQANLSNEVFKTHSSIFFQITDTSVDSTFSLYVEPGKFIEKSSHVYLVWNNEEKIMNVYDFDDSVAYCALFGAGSEEYAYLLPNYESPVFQWTSEEIAENFVEENGKLILTTTIPAEISINAGRNIAEDSVEVTKYTVDAETLLIENINIYERTTDGTETFLDESIISYDVAPIEQPEEFTAAFDIPDAVTVNAVFDPGTDEEQIFSTEIKAGIQLDVWRGEAYRYAYSDPECTELITEPTPSEYAENGVATLYFAKDK